MVPGLLNELRGPTPDADDRKILNFIFNGYRISLGKNSFSNERLVKEHPHRECLWMHAMAARGSHVVLCLFSCPEPDPEILQYAARLALEHSHSAARTVEVSLLKDVFKPNDSRIGIWKTRRSMALEVDE